jgi:hypothetical protein
VDQKQTVARLLEKANKYRDFARLVGDSETVQRISALTEELKQRARAMAKPNEDKIRKRAREIWEENNRPVGRDEEFWFQAEREFREAEDLAKATTSNLLPGPLEGQGRNNFQKGCWFYRVTSSTRSAACTASSAKPYPP